MVIRSIIIDDEANNVENLRSLLHKHFPAIKVVATANNADQGLSLIDSHKPDLIFLDIQMPVKNGFDMLKAISKIDFEIIFVTAFDQYGIQAIKFSALDYLLKPIDVKELTDAIRKAEDRITAKQKNSNIWNLMDYLKSGPKASPKIALPTLKEIQFVPVHEIVRCEASDNYTTFYLQNRESILVCKTLKEFAELLTPHGFIRTHHSHLVNGQFSADF
jgi:two-component system LytT family response regulator